MLKKRLANIGLTVSWHSAELRCIKLASIRKMLLRGFLNLPSFEINSGEEGLSPTPPFKKSFLAPYQESKGIPSETL